LATCPLAQEPRGSLIRLFPIIASPEVITASESIKIDQIATVAADQLFVFYKGNATRLFALGETSLARGDIEASRKAFFAAIELNPNMTSAVMTHVRRVSDLGVAETIPNESRAMQIAVADYLRWDTPDPAFLKRATETIRCGEGDSMVQRAHCHALVGSIYFQLNNVEKGKDYFERAIRLAPDLASHRVELIEFLLKNDLIADARGHARQGRQSLPDDPRFQRFIDQISASESEQLIQPNSRPAVDSKKIEAILATPSR
jgi:tetratricopeptide (TPR) repeat protein